MHITESDLAARAITARQFAYAPYSGFTVGAALLCKDGTIYTGCNVESAAFAPTVCAERTAFVKAVSEGKRDFAAIAITGGKQGTPGDYCYPCGVCRQVIAEFCSGAFTVLIVRTPTDWQKITLEELLPHRFGPDSLQ